MSTQDTQGGEGTPETPRPKGFTRVPPDERRCIHVYPEGEKEGQRCVGWALREQEARLCAGHAGLGIAASPEAARAAQALGAERRSEEASAAKKTPIQVYRDALRVNAEKLSARLLEIAANGNDSDSLRAIEQLTSRVMGKPKDHVELETKAPAVLADLAAMTQEERLAFIRERTPRLRAVGED